MKQVNSQSDPIGSTDKPELDLKVRVLIADHVPLIREGLRGIFERHTEFELVAEASDGREAIELFQAHQPDVVVIEADMPRLAGVAVVEQICETEDAPKVIVFSSRLERDLVAQALKAGACGFVCKQNSAEELTQAVSQVALGGVYLSPQVVQLVVEQLIRPLDLNQRHGRLQQLTAREREVAQLLSEGLTPREIAGQLHVSIKTVDTHRYQILKKLELKNSAELTRLALEEGLIQISC